MIKLNMEALLCALENKLGRRVTLGDFSVSELKGGTIAEVHRITGTVHAADDHSHPIPYTLVIKKQKKWERPGDPASWRREYDLYAPEFETVFHETTDHDPLFHRPVCWLREMSENEDEITLWLESIEGASGSALTTAMNETAAYALGAFQGKTRVTALPNTACLGDIGFVEREFQQWHTQIFSREFLVSQGCRIPEALKQAIRNNTLAILDGKSFEYSALRSDYCDLPPELRGMLTHLDSRQAELFADLKKLPVVLCHRDYWSENIFYSNGQISAIDWDTAGLGFAGEDLASLIFDDTDPHCYAEYIEKLYPAYIRGLSEQIDTRAVSKERILSLAKIRFGYRMFQRVLFARSPEDRAAAIIFLEKLYEIDQSLQS